MQILTNYGLFDIIKVLKYFPQRKEIFAKISTLHSKTA